MTRNIEALRQLRRVVAAAPDHLLHMRSIVERSACGTARCALGWAIVDPWFQQNTDINKALPADYCGNGLYDDDKWETIYDVFGLSRDDARALFGAELPCSHNPRSDPHEVSKLDVLDNIDRLIDGRHADVYEAALTFGDNYDE